MLRIIQNRTVSFLISAVVISLSLGATLAWGLKLGIDFTGGSLLELEFSKDRPAIESVLEVVVQSVGEEEVTAQPLGEKGMVVRMPTLAEASHQSLIAAIKTAYDKDGNEVVEKRFESIGPIIGDELRRKTVYAVFGAIIAIVLYITWVFRKVSHPISSWKYGVCTIAALLHDIVIPVGLLSALGHYLGLEVGAWIVTALLTVLGFSVHDTIVVFDRIRENLTKARRENFEELVNKSINETLARSINTSLTVLIVLALTWFLGGESTRHFIMTLFVGIFVGTYSSIFIASPLLVTWQLHDQLKRDRR
jgi:preprotein translocase subunit SecF